MLAEARSEVRKQVCREEFLDNSVSDLQRQLDSTRLEIHSTNQGYEESWEEQARLHDEFTQGERVLRETQIRSIHELGELKTDQEMGIDESSRNELRESHATMQELTSHTLELQEKVSFVNDSAEFQDVESICSGKNLTFPVSRQSSQVLDLCWAATKASDLIHGICLGPGERFVAVHEQ